MTSEFSTEEYKAEENGMASFKYWKKKLMGILYALKIPSKNDGKVRMPQTKTENSLPV